MSEEVFKQLGSKAMVLIVFWGICLGLRLIIYSGTIPVFLRDLPNFGGSPLQCLDKTLIFTPEF